MLNTKPITRLIAINIVVIFAFWITIDELFGKNTFDRIVVDLSELSFMDSTGIGVLVGRYKKMKEKIKSVIATLNNIEVKGAGNLSRLLACIQTLEEVIEHVAENE